MFRFVDIYSLGTVTVIDARLFRLLVGILTPLALVFGLLLLPQVAQAGGNVSTCDEASLDAALAGGGLITFTCGPATIVVTSQKLITGKTTIDGGGVITISGGNTTRIFQVFASDALTLTNITIANGNAAANYAGGAIANYGSLDLSHVVFKANTGGNGGAIYSEGPVYASATSFISNSAVHGGGINAYHTVLTLTDVTFIGNAAQNAGGGIYNNSGTNLSLSGGNFAENTADTYGGGGLINDGTALLTYVTFQNNFGHNYGGGIYNDGLMTVTQSSVFSNSTYLGNGAYAGGGLANLGGGILNLGNVTIAGNAAMAAGGIYNTGVLSLSNVTLSSNTGGPGNLYNDANPAFLMNTVLLHSNLGNNCTGPAISLGHNLSSDTSCTDLTSAGDITDTDPLLGPLRDNGGPTWTMAPLQGSPIINAGDNNGCPSTAQRGVTRPQGPVCDIGAFEVRVPTLTSISPNTATAFEMPLGLRVTGTNFLNGSVVLWENTPLASGFVSSTLLTATVPSNLLLAGVLTVTVSNPSPEAGIAVPSLPFTVSKANQTLTFAALPDRTYGDPDFDPGASASSGLTVTYSTSNNCVGSGSSVHLTGVGSCAIQAQQVGDMNYNSAAAITRTFSITKANQAITFVQPISPAMYGTTFSITPTASSGLAVSVAASGSCTVLSGTVTITSSTGICTLTASQAGNVDYNAATPVVRDVTAIKANQTITFNPLADKTIGEPPFAITGTATSGLAVTFTAGGACAVLGNTVTLSAAGSCTLTAHQLGDMNYNAAPDVAHGFAINDAMLYLPLIVR